MSIWQTSRSPHLHSYARSPWESLPFALVAIVRRPRRRSAARHRTSDIGTSGAGS